jgi:hypothetical protein
MSRAASPRTSEHAGGVKARPGRERPLAGAAPGHFAAAETRADLT